MNNKLFSSEVIGKGITRITGAGNELMYLIEGKSKAALLDTGIGVGNIRDYVENLTSLPIIVLLTHAHIDHSAGAFWFHEVYLNERDAILLDLEFNNTQCQLMYQDMKDFVAAANNSLAIDLQSTDFVKPYRKKFLSLNDGDIFDLGNITLEILACPGHTQGSVMVLIKEERAILFGDSCNPSVWMFLPESSTIGEYRESLLKIQERSSEYDKVYLSHNPNDASKDILDKVINICHSILEENIVEVPYIGLGDNVFIAQSNTCSDVLENDIDIPVRILYK
jgi:glyoxylase-like metal-dependent hydrolase (beta-lactamase superfamily II)